MKNKELQEKIDSAFNDLYEIVKRDRQEQGKYFPQDMIMAKRAVDSKEFNGSKKVNLGINRLIRLINEYAPDSFDIQITIKRK